MRDVDKESPDVESVTDISDTRATRRDTGACVPGRSVIAARRSCSFMAAASFVAASTRMIRFVVCSRPNLPVWSFRSTTACHPSTPFQPLSMTAMRQSAGWPRTVLPTAAMLLHSSSPVTARAQPTQRLSRSSPATKADQKSTTRSFITRRSITRHPEAYGSNDCYAKGYWLDSAPYCIDLYLPDPATRRNPLASPLYAESLEHLPAAYICTAGFDPLRDQGALYASQLAKAGVAVTYENLDNMLHGFISCRGLVAEADDVIRRSVAAL